jgi:hypothetical protein
MAFKMGRFSTRRQLQDRQIVRELDQEAAVAVADPEELQDPIVAEAEAAGDPVDQDNSQPVVEEGTQVGDRPVAPASGERKAGKRRQAS